MSADNLVPITEEMIANAVTIRGKAWYKSRTLWLNVAAGVTTIVTAVAVIMPSIQGLMSVETYLIISAAVNVTNIVLRKYFTSTAIE